MEETQKITIVVPALNEAAKLEPLLGVLTRSYDQVIIAANGSTDNTHQIAKKFGVKTCGGLKRLGKGGGILEAVKHVGSKYFVTLDVDYKNVHCIEFLVGFYEKTEVDILVGKRVFLNKRPFKRLVASIAFHALATILFGKLPDTQSGVKVIKTEVLEKLGEFKTKNYLWDLELIVKAKKRGFKIFEYPIPETYSEERNFHVFRDGFQMCKDLVMLRVSEL